jgi:hypothetical protein
LIVLSVSAASAFPRNNLVLPAAEVDQVHHKPGHMGGPPWLRRNRPGLGHHYGWDRRRGWDRGDRMIERRRGWRDERDAPWSSYGRWYD